MTTDMFGCVEGLAGVLATVIEWDPWGVEAAEMERCWWPACAYWQSSSSESVRCRVHVDDGQWGLIIDGRWFQLPLLDQRRRRFLRLFTSCFSAHISRLLLYMIW